MPRLDINLEDLKPWCLFHNVHGCPCDKYKDPLEYGPDVNTSRNVARRSIGNKFKTKFTTEKIVRKPSTTTDQDVTLMNEGISYDFFGFFFSNGTFFPLVFLITSHVYVPDKVIWSSQLWICKLWFYPNIE